MRQRFWVCFAVVVACGGTQTTPGDGASNEADSGRDGAAVATPPADPVPLDQFVGRLVDATCGGVGTCCVSNGFAFDQAACEALVASQSTGNACPAGTAYDPQLAGDCVAATRLSYTACVEPRTCDHPCVGTKPLGAECLQTSECATSATGTVVCWYSDVYMSLTGVCSVLLRGTVGAACNVTCTAETGPGTMEQCNRGVEPPPPGPGAEPATLPATPTDCYTSDGLFCGSDWTCHPLGAPGAPCMTPFACQQGAYCDTVTSSCVARPAIGSACGLKSLCVEGAYCSSGVCASKRAAGEPCTGGECAGKCDTATGTCDAPGVARIHPTTAMCAMK
jgi:hypothetical protein